MKKIILEILELLEKLNNEKNNPTLKIENLVSLNKNLKILVNHNLTKALTLLDKAELNDSKMVLDNLLRVKLGLDDYSMIIYDLWNAVGDMLINFDNDRKKDQ